MLRYDVEYTAHSTNIIPHFCREVGCYGTNPHHGCTWEEAKQEIIDSYEVAIQTWERQEEWAYFD